VNLFLTLGFGLMAAAIIVVAFLLFGVLSAIQQALVGAALICSAAVADGLLPPCSGSKTTSFHPPSTFPLFALLLFGGGRHQSLAFRCFFVEIRNQHQLKNSMPPNLLLSFVSG
jgi:hypothetical protein